MGFRGTCPTSKKKEWLELSFVQACNLLELAFLLDFLLELAKKRCVLPPPNTGAGAASSSRARQTKPAKKAL